MTNVEYDTIRVTTGNDLTLISWSLHVDIYISSYYFMSL